MPPPDSNVIPMPHEPTPDEVILTEFALNHLTGMCWDRMPEALARALVIHRLLDREAPRIRREVQEILRR